jgi:hypothetical protein
VSISSGDHTDSIQSNGEYDLELDSDVDMCMQDDVDAPDDVDLNGDVDMARDGEDAEDAEEDNEKEKDVVDKHEDVDNDKKPRTIGQEEMISTSADDADTMVDAQPTVLPKKGQEFCEYTPWPKLPPSAPWPRTPEPCSQTRTTNTHTASWLELLGHVTAQ